MLLPGYSGCLSVQSTTILKNARKSVKANSAFAISVLCRYIEAMSKDTDEKPKYYQPDKYEYIAAILLFAAFWYFDVYNFIGGYVEAGTSVLFGW
jgi:hypothetical protein